MPREDHYRSRSADAHHLKRRRSHSRSRSPTRTAQDRNSKPLPFAAQNLSKRDLRTYRPLFALYLDIQKQLDIEDLEESEVKGRWKSFVNKWNHGDLAEGWYDSQTLDKAIRANSDLGNAHPNGGDSQDEDDDDFGPTLPSNQPTSPGHRTGNPSGAGPAIPTTSDLQARDEQAVENAIMVRQQDRLALQYDRKADRKLQRERLDDLAPTAAPGTRERQLEKKRDAATSNASFAASAHDSSAVDLPDSEVMGSDTVSDLKRMKAENERKKNERELKREEILRARRAEREERLKVMREKEDKTMEGLKELARARFG